jgi:hypothetical protein
MCSVSYWKSFFFELFNAYVVFINFLFNLLDTLLCFEYFIFDMCEEQAKKIYILDFRYRIFITVALERMQLCFSSIYECKEYLIHLLKLNWGIHKSLYLNILGL